MLIPFDLLSYSETGAGNHVVVCSNVCLGIAMILAFRKNKSGDTRNSLFVKGIAYFVIFFFMK